MTLLTTELEVRWHYSNKEHYLSITDNDENSKYIFTKNNMVFTVDIEDAHPKSTVKIEIKCDYCGNIEGRTYYNWKTHFDKSPVKKDACKKCRGLKIKESNLLLYGVENVMQVQKFKENMENTNLEKYGVKYAGASDIVQEKVKQYNIDNYGVEHFFQTNQFKESYIESMQEKYGVDNSFQAEEVKLKSRQTMIDRYGVEYNMQHPKFREQAVQSMYERSSTPTSYQQLKLNEIFKGHLNYPIERYNVDILLLDDDIVIEYDGGGHDLKVKLGGMTEKEFIQRASIRSGVLKRNKLFTMTIVSRKDFLPSKEKLNEMLEFSKVIKEQDRSWITFDIDSLTYETRNGKYEYDYGELTKWRRRDKEVV